MPQLAAVILAGGRASRLGGGDKTLLELAGKPVLAHVIERLRPQASPIAINANGDPGRFAQFNLPVVGDLQADFAGPLAGLEAGLIWAVGNGAAQLLLLAGDTPFFPTDLGPQLRESSDGRIAVATSFGRVHPTFSLWPTVIAGDLGAFLRSGGRRMTAFIEQYSHAMVDFPAARLPGGEIDAFFNINTPDDLAEARRLVKTSGA